MDGRCAYLNNAMTSFPKRVQAVDAFLAEVHALPVAARHEAGAAVQSTKEHIAAHLAVDPHEVFLVSDATLALNIAVHGLVGPGTTVAVDNRAHNAVLRAITGRGARLLEVPVYDRDERVDDGAVAALLADAPPAVCLTHVSNVTGTVYDVGPLVADLKAAGSVVIIDASQAAGVVPLAPVAGADVIVFPAHKHLHGLPGAAALVTRRPLAPLVFGGTGTRSASTVTDEPGRLFTEVGTGNPMAAAALGAVVTDLDQRLVVRDQKLSTLVARLRLGLDEIPGVRSLPRGPSPFESGIVSVAPQHGDPELTWAPRLARAGVVVRGGLHCSPSVHRQLDLPLGSVRLSLSGYTTEDEVDLALERIAELAGALDAIA